MDSTLVGKIEHIVVVMLENRGFDTALGYLYARDDPPNQQIPPVQCPVPEQLFDGLDFIDSSTLKNAGVHHGEQISQGPVPGVRATNSTGWDPGEEFEHVNAQLYDIAATNYPPADASTRMTGFIRDYSEQCSGDAESVRQIMHMFTPADLPVLNTLARRYAVSDRWFASVPTQTNANRAFSLCGTSHGLVDNGFLTSNPVSQKLANDRFDVPTLWNVLEKYGSQDWGIFWEDAYPAIIGGGKPYTRNLFPHLNSIPNVDERFRKMEAFHAMAASGSLPAFSYIEPSWGGYALGLSVMGNDYHPPSDVTPGEEFLRRIYASLRSNVSAWNKTLLLIVFDEHGGTYDHVPPPDDAIAPWGDEQSPDLPKGPQYDFDFKRFGLRVPAIAVSPLIEDKTVFRSGEAQPFDHTSIIATVLEWMLPEVERDAWGLGERTKYAPTINAVVTRDTPRTDDVFAAPRQTTNGIRFGEPFVLQHMDSELAITKAYSGEKSYYPTLTAATPQVLEFRFGFGAVRDGDVVQIRTNEYLTPERSVSPGMFAGIRNFLGAWRDDPYCYYYSSDDAVNYQQQYWSIKRIGNSGGPIGVGDRVQLLSPYWNGQALCSAGKYLSTQPDSTEYWTIGRPAIKEFV